MVTTIQINEKTLLLLKKLKEELKASSYDDAIIKISVQRTKKESYAGSLKRYMGKKETIKDMLKEMQEERHKSDRF